MHEASLTDQRLCARIAANPTAPLAHDRERAESVLEDLARRSAADTQLSPLGALLAEPPIRNLLAGIFGASPYLTSLIERDPLRLLSTLSSVPERRFAALTADLTRSVSSSEATSATMQLLRVFKSDVALLTALCDLAGIWEVMTVTRYLSQAADAAVAAAVRFLFRQASKAGDWLADEAQGYIVLAMGK